MSIRFMPIVRNLAIVLLLFGFGRIPSASVAQEQKQVNQIKNEVNEVNKDQKIRALESRVERLEEIVFATLRISELEAERQVARARQQLEHSERLFSRGMLTDARINQDRLALQLAERELKLAKSSGQSRKLGAEIDLLRAKNNLQVAKDNFKLAQRRADRGLLSSNDLEFSRKSISIAERRLELAKKRLSAIENAAKTQDDKEENQKPNSAKAADEKKK